MILREIYPAREKPIPGVTSELIYENLKPGVEKRLCRKEDVPEVIKDESIEVLILLGAGDLDKYVPQICEILNEQ